MYFIPYGSDSLVVVLKVPLTGGVEVWLEHLQQSVKSTIHNQVLAVCHDVGTGVSCEEWANKACVPTLICHSHHILVSNN